MIIAPLLRLRAPLAAGELAELLSASAAVDMHAAAAAPNAPTRTLRRDVELGAVSVHSVIVGFLHWAGVGYVYSIMDG
jgi:hypothetical protein